MRYLDPGHHYELQGLEFSSPQQLRFIKRLGDNYPGNIPPSYSGTNCQEPLRAVIQRCRYLNHQFWCVETTCIIQLLRFAVWLFEFRAARLHHRWPPFKTTEVIQCKHCGHVKCKCIMPVNPLPIPH